VITARKTVIKVKVMAWPNPALRKLSPNSSRKLIDASVSTRRVVTTPSRASAKNRAIPKSVQISNGVKMAAVFEAEAEVISFVYPTPPRKLTASVATQPTMSTAIAERGVTGMLRADDLPIGKSRNSTTKAAVTPTAQISMIVKKGSVS
jgi:hypothetical protein